MLGKLGNSDTNFNIQCNPVFNHEAGSSCGPYNIHGRSSNDQISDKLLTMSAVF